MNEKATAALAASISTLGQAATVLLMGFLGDRLGRRRVLIAALLVVAIGRQQTSPAAGEASPS